MSKKIIAYACTCQSKGHASVTIVQGAATLGDWIIRLYGQLPITASIADEQRFKGSVRLVGDYVPDDTAVFFDCDFQDRAGFLKLEQEMDEWLQEEKDWTLHLQPISQEPQSSFSVFEANIGESGFEVKTFDLIYPGHSG